VVIRAHRHAAATRTHHALGIRPDVDGHAGTEHVVPVSTGRPTSRVYDHDTVQSGWLVDQLGQHPDGILACSLHEDQPSRRCCFRPPMLHDSFEARTARSGRSARLVGCRLGSPRYAGRPLRVRADSLPLAQPTHQTLGRLAHVVGQHAVRQRACLVHGQFGRRMAAPAGSTSWGAAMLLRGERTFRHQSRESRFPPALGATGHVARASCDSARPVRSTPDVCGTATGWPPPAHAPGPAACRCPAACCTRRAIP